MNGAATAFALDGQFFIRELQGGATYATYLTGPTGPLYRRGETLRWYIYDGLGSVLGEVDASGNLDASRTYDVYGLARSVTRTPTSKHAWVGQLGHTTEDETGLVYMRARYMDPVVGRFLSEDSAGEGHNWFVYCGDSPINNTDATGKGEDPSLENLLGFLTVLRDIGIPVPNLPGNYTRFLEKEMQYKAGLDLCVVGIIAVVAALAVVEGVVLPLLLGLTMAVLIVGVVFALVDAIWCAADFAATGEPGTPASDASGNSSSEE